MSFFAGSRKGQTWFLVISLCFNMGFLAAFGIHFIRTHIHFHSSAANHVHGHLQHLVHNLNLSQEQQEKLEQSRNELVDELNGFMKELEQNREELIILISDKNVDPEQVYRKLAEMETIQLAVQRRVIKSMLDEKCVLGDEQCRTYGLMIRKACGGENSDVATTCVPDN